MDEQILKELKEGTEPEVFGEALAFLEQKGVIRYEDFRNGTAPWHFRLPVIRSLRS